MKLTHTHIAYIGLGIVAAIWILNLIQ